MMFSKITGGNTNRGDFLIIEIDRMQERLFLLEKDSRIHQY